MMWAESLSTLRNYDYLDSTHTNASFITLKMVLLHHWRVSIFKLLLLLCLMELLAVKLLTSLHQPLTESCLKTRNYV